MDKNMLPAQGAPSTPPLLARGGDIPARYIAPPLKERQSSKGLIASFKLSGFTVYSARGVLLWLALICTWTDGPLGNINAILFFGFTVLAAVVYFGHTLFVVSRYWFYLLFPIFAMITAFWSEAPDLSFRWGLELLVTCLGGLLVARNLTSWSVVKTIFLGTLILVLLCVPYAPRAWATRGALNGIFESKNILGFTAHTLFTSRLVLMLWDRTSIALRLFAAPVCFLALVMLFLAQSAGATMSIVVSTATVLAGSVYIASPARFRILWVLAIAVAAAAMLFILPLLVVIWQDIQQNVLHKDTTLTGRTYLWEFAGRLIRERPWFGHGANAFWRQGNLDAEGLWERYKIGSRHGFSFHNTIIETTVGTGYVGLSLFLLLIGTIGVRLIFNFIRRPAPGNLFLIAFFAAFYLRLPTEVVVGPFDAPVVLLLSAAAFRPEVIQESRKKVKKRARLADRWRASAPPAGAVVGAAAMAAGRRSYKS